MSLRNNKYFRYIYPRLRFPFSHHRETKAWKGFYQDFDAFVKQKGNDNTFFMGKEYPFIYEKEETAGQMSGHYYHQDLFVAQQIFNDNPIKHIDIGSRTDGFVAHVASYREIEVFDIRKQVSKSKNIVFQQADLMQLPNGLENYCDSISSLHVLEHFGLGRYGDPIDYMGHLMAIKNITKILKSEGKFYFSSPIGPQRIEFNAHRVFSVKYLLSIFEADFTLNSFSCVDDKGDLHENALLNQENIDSNFGCNFGCGILCLTKK
jgi:SAM-dependent methyltransferase